MGGAHWCGAVQKLYEVLGGTPEVILYHLDRLFPVVMNFQKIKLSASGEDLGGDMLFDVRLGFSGTPSNLLPKSMQPCRMEPGSEARIVRLLSDPTYVDTTHITEWTPDSLLDFVANHRSSGGTGFHALIDRGALITGMTNIEVARALLDKGLEGMQGCIYFDDRNHKMVLLRGQAQPMPLSECGIPKAQRFAFYDQVHTVGQDIKMTRDAVAAVSLGKDVTLRDFSQACWRMRQLGEGQRIHVICIDEIYRLVKRAHDSGCMPVDIVAWLTLNSIRSSQLQFMQLCTQNISNVWRHQAFHNLLKVTAPDWAGDGSSGLLTRFNTSAKVVATDGAASEESDANSALVVAGMEGMSGDYVAGYLQGFHDAARQAAEASAKLVNKAKLLRTGRGAEAPILVRDVHGMRATPISSSLFCLPCRP